VASVDGDPINVMLMAATEKRIKTTADAVADLKHQHRVYSAYHNRWVDINTSDPRMIGMDGRRKVLGESKDWTGYKTGMVSGKLEQKIKLTCPTNAYVLDFIKENAQYGYPMAKIGEGKGREVYICGNGRGLPKHAGKIKRDGMANTVDVWGCNGAVNWLWQNNVKVTHGFTTDTSHRMYQECWVNPPPIHYLIATCVNPKTVDQLMAAGAKGVTFFHNYTGVDGEIPLYQSLYPGAPLVGEGLNSVNRALALALMMDYDKIYLLGCVEHLDPKSKHHHADGGDSNQEYILVAHIDNRKYATHADLLYSAIDLVKQERRSNGTLPKAMWRQLPLEERSQYVYDGDGTYRPRGREKKITMVGHRRDLGMVLRTKSDDFLNRCIKFG